MNEMLSIGSSLPSSLRASAISHVKDAFLVG